MDLPQMAFSFHTTELRAKKVIVDIDRHLKHISVACDVIIADGCEHTR